MAFRSSSLIEACWAGMSKRGIDGFIFKEYNLQNLKLRPVLIIVAMAIGFGGWGLTWGLPSLERRDLFLPTSLRTPDFYRKLSTVRSERYEKIGFSPVAYA